jgi:hypothetical protein
MTMSEEKLTADLDKPANEEKNEESSGGADESEFKLTVRKLEIPVRPRGVLAE